MDNDGMEFLLDAVDRFRVTEEFADNLEQPDPVPLLYLLRNEVADLSPEDVTATSGLAEKSVEFGLAAATEIGRRRRDASPAKSAQSTDRVNPEAPGWTKRLRLGSAPPDHTPCPSRRCALEISIRKYAEQPDKSVVRPEMGLAFDSLGEAYDFYNLYSWEIGFGIRENQKP
ncbi:uncharacterized protein LOC123408261 isoform X2 [Hordeum vulgare subsp. vulgare]|uniref:uncharacterized protein LOC123408261 isoform X2 n=1 Tax=Hordeum vulgare subsp. vulgare TaxID=112509 RepID=UPI001D1A4F51|nr:uncharacterized protein LOC123408261 isoform X2 [Hordeum vulgare subsp. vulgare]